MSTAVILGVTFSTDFSFRYHFSTLVKKVNYDVQSLTTLQWLGFPVNKLLLAYIYHIRPLLKYACRVWGTDTQHWLLKWRSRGCSKNGRQKPWWTPNMTRMQLQLQRWKYQHREKGDSISCASLDSHSTLVKNTVRCCVPSLPPKPKLDTRPSSS